MQLISSEQKPCDHDFIISTQTDPKTERMS
uniref:Uncharacterized protein n=1 Tax=Anguilla anguilla TaxID=7936 RepID=A0A0E9SVB1_ANGAN